MTPRYYKPQGMRRIDWKRLSKLWPGWSWADTIRPVRPSDRAVLTRETANDYSLRYRNYSLFRGRS